MARRQGSGCGCGCATVLVALLVVAAFCAWHFGLIDRLLYMASVQTGSSSISSETSQRIDSQERGLYVYDQLGEEDRELYRIMLDSFQSREPRVYPETDMDEVARMRDLVLADHPELFYINGVSQLTTTNRGSGLVVDLTVEGQYAYSEEESAKLQGLINDAVAQCFAAAPAATDDYDLAKYFYEYLATLTEYDREAAVDSAGADDDAASTGQTIADVFVSRKAVCGGYARAYQYLLQRSGIQCAYVVGDANGGRHAWCVAYLDGAYYFIDPTWGDPQFLSDEGEAVEQDDFVNYDYLCLTSQDIGKNHVATSPFDMPDCTSMADNYYVREGLMFDYADVDRLGSLVAEAAATGGNVQIRCADSDVYDQLLGAVSNGDLAQYLPGNAYRFTHSDNFLTMTVFTS